MVLDENELENHVRFERVLAERFGGDVGSEAVDRFSCRVSDKVGGCAKAGG